MSSADRPVPETVYCARHPEVETGLRCSRCDTPICPRCAVQTPVGARCPDCARLQRLPTYQISPAQYLGATGLGLGVALVGGILWAVVPLGGFFAFFIAAGMGWLLADVVGRAVNHKRGPGLQVLAGVLVVVTIWVRGIFGAVAALGPAVLSTPHLSELLIRVTLGLVLDPWTWLLAAIGVIVAVSQLR